MDDLLGLVIGLVLLALFVGGIVLPIVSLIVSIRTRRKLNQTISRFESLQSAGGATTPKSLQDVVQQLTVRVARLEAAMKIAPPGASPKPAEERPPETVTPPPPTAVQPPTPIAQAPPPVAPPPPSYAPASTTRTIRAGELESIIGRRWLGWAAIGLILFATAFFLKYAFDNRWIGELGRVAIGVGAGITLTVLGFRYHKRGWRVFSQILTGGGIVLLYLSAYASFGFYHLAPQRAAFVYMTILIAEAAVLALLYNAPAIAVMALLGGFLVPVLLRSDRDQYRALFGYIFALDVATLALLRHWVGLSSIAFGGTHLLFWLWYVDNYHPRKVAAVITFQAAVFLAFLFAQVASRWLKKEEIEFDDLAAFVSNPFKFITSFENFALLIINPFVFFATAYHLLNPNYHAWMGTLAVGMALIYAAVAKLLLNRKAMTRTELLLVIGVALAFITLAIPIQFKTNWITIAWAIEGLVILWAGIEIRSSRLRAVAHGVFALALLKLVFWDTPYGYRAPFTPVLNKYFLSSLFVTACLFTAALAYQRLGERKQILARTFQLVILIVAIATLWFIMSVETHTFFTARAARLKAAEDIRHQRWLGQMTLSVLWSTYAALLAAIGFIKRTAAVRWAALALFALTVVKVMIVDISVLRQLYRIIAFLVLGLLLLIVAWGYHKVFHSKESQR
ncbi:MAG TPA: DUF2339 domain-containing protein [Pyrinomonadaceae bacterium]|nr:DUF2339 domain-containing protein [Pyrinomonadaceae bacterium]